MKRFLSFVAIALISIAFAINASAQFNYGVIGGVTMSSGNPSEWKLTKQTLWHAGATIRMALPLGFAIQPSVLYQVRGTQVPTAVEQAKSFDYTAGYLEVPVSLQWGPDLLILRPYFECVPYFGYALNNRYRGEQVQKNDWTGLNRWEYGVGVGAGIEVWHFQISARYNWNFGTLFDAKQEITSAESFAAVMRERLGNSSRFGGVTISLAVLF